MRILSIILPMKTRSEILRLLSLIKPKLKRKFGVTRLALFGSYARGDQKESSDVDILVETSPSIGLRFVHLSEELENALAVKTDVVSHRAIKPTQMELIKREIIDVP